MNEYELIRAMAGRFPRHPAQENEPFTCDAEIIRLGDELWGLTMDEFTPEEDRFTMEEPEILGANLANATLSDLYAAGAEPASHPEKAGPMPSASQPGTNRSSRRQGSPSNP